MSSQLLQPWTLHEAFLALAALALRLWGWSPPPRRTPCGQSLQLLQVFLHDPVSLSVHLIPETPGVTPSKLPTKSTKSSAPLGIRTFLKAWSFLPYLLSSGFSGFFYQV